MLISEMMDMEVVGDEASVSRKARTTALDEAKVKMRKAG